MVTAMLVHIDAKKAWLNAKPWLLLYVYGRESKTELMERGPIKNCLYLGMSGRMQGYINYHRRQRNTKKRGK